MHCTALKGCKEVKIKAMTSFEMSFTKVSSAICYNVEKTFRAKTGIMV